MGWRGLLIEPDPKTFQQLKKKNRRAHLANVCLSSQLYPEQVRAYLIWCVLILILCPGQLTLYRHIKYTEGNTLIFNPAKEISKDNSVHVQCVPLETLLIASELRQIDLFSLDVEGLELEILKGINFDRLGVKVSICMVLHKRLSLQRNLPMHRRKFDKPRCNQPHQASRQIKWKFFQLFWDLPFNILCKHNSHAESHKILKRHQTTNAFL